MAYCEYSAASSTCSKDKWVWLILLELKLVFVLSAFFKWLDFFFKKFVEAAEDNIIVHNVDKEFQFRIGMTFANEDEACKTYNAYAISKRFCDIQIFGI